LEIDRFIDYWPLVFVAIGLVKLLSPGPGRAWSLLWIVAGVWLLLNNLNLLAFDFWDLWPLVMVLAGLGLVAGALRRGGRTGYRTDEAEVRALAVMAGNELTNASRQFTGGDLAAVMGACHADLRGASIEAGTEAVLDTFAVWGGVEITVPEDWEVLSKVIPVMGAFEDSTRPPLVASGKRLVVRGFAVMGAVEVNNTPSED
jgi:hypothetical protein